MIKNYRTELRSTGIKDEYQMYYIQETLSAEAEAEIAQLVAERQTEIINEKEKEI